MALADQVIGAARTLRKDLADLRFAAPVAMVYQPLDYAWDLHRSYLKRFAASRKQVLFLGMNPGPFGMVQTGIPFGEIAAVRDWMRLTGSVTQPAEVHAKRPIQGLDCPRSEVSGRRLWGAIAERFPDPDDFFCDHLVINYCPLAFLGETGRNITPDKLTAAERDALAAPCDRHLLRLITLLQPAWCIGVGAYARQCFERVLATTDRPTARIGQILHPSPASPAANRGWAVAATKQLQALGLWPGEIA